MLGHFSKRLVNLESPLVNFTNSKLTSFDDLKDAQWLTYKTGFKNTVKFCNWRFWRLSYTGPCLWLIVVTANFRPF